MPSDPLEALGLRLFRGAVYVSCCWKLRSLFRGTVCAVLMGGESRSYGWGRRFLSVHETVRFGAPLPMTERRARRRSRS
jgi:hypothetical protein